MSRFSKENIDKLVLVPKKGIFHSIRKLAGPIIDLSGLIGAILLLSLYLYTGLDFILIPFFAAIIFQFILIYFLFIKFYQIKVNKYRIDIGLGKEATFVFVSDLHLGKEYTSTSKIRLNKIINKINALSPELVLLGGDFLTYDIVPDLLKEISNINAKQRLAVFGNHDADYLEHNVQYNSPTEFIEAFKTSNFELLINEHRIVNVNGVNLCIGGIPDLYSKTFNIDETFSGSSDNLKKILIAHNPDTIDFIDEEDNISLVLSGHNHSGQIFLPVIGPVLPMPTKRRWLTKGIFNINKNTKLFLSQGVGYSGSRLRINTESEICLITVY